MQCLLDWSDLRNESHRGKLDYISLQCNVNEKKKMLERYPKSDFILEFHVLEL